MKKRKPTGFVAICQCGEIIGAMDYTRTDHKDAGRLLGEWLADGCTIESRFEDTWSERVSTCKCESYMRHVVSKRACKTCKHRTKVLKEYKGKCIYNCLSNGYEVTSEHKCDKWQPNQNVDSTTKK